MHTWHLAMDVLLTVAHTRNNVNKAVGHELCLRKGVLSRGLLLCHWLFQYQLNLNDDRSVIEFVELSVFICYFIYI